MEDIVVQIQDWVMLYGLKMVAAIIILVVGRFAATAVRSAIHRTLKKWQIDTMLVSFISSLCYFCILAFVIVAALSQIGVQTASIVAVLGAAGLAVGLALQGSLANFAAGVLMLIFKPFKIGDYIEGGGVAGVVEEIGVFMTEMKSPDNKKILVPNAKMTSDHIINYSANKIRRVDMIASVSYNDDLEKVKKVLQDILDQDDRVLKDPTPTIGVLALADSSIDFVVRPWVQTPDYWNVFYSTQENIKKRFDAEGISIPFPQQDVHLQKTQA